MKRTKKGLRDMWSGGTSVRRNKICNCAACPHSRLWLGRGCCRASDRRLSGLQKFARGQRVADSCPTRASCYINKVRLVQLEVPQRVTPGGRVVEVVVTIIRRALTVYRSPRSTLPQLSPYLTIMSFKKDDEAGGICTCSLNDAAHTLSFLPRQIHCYTRSPRLQRIAHISQEMQGPLDPDRIPSIHRGDFLHSGGHHPFLWCYEAVPTQGCGCPSNISFRGATSWSCWIECAKANGLSGRQRALHHCGGCNHGNIFHHEGHAAQFGSCVQA